MITKDLIYRNLVYFRIKNIFVQLLLYENILYEYFI